MAKWYMLTVVGTDRTGMVAGLTKTLFEHNCNLGEASMARLGDSFTMMMMVRSPHDETHMRDWLSPFTQSLKLHYHLDAIDGHLHRHLEPNVRISVFGADRAGIVAQVTGAMAAAGLHVVHLETNVAGTDARPIYVMHIEGIANQGVEALRAAAKELATAGVDIGIEDIDTLIG